MAQQGKGGYKLLSKNWSEYNKQTSAVLELEGVSKDALLKYQLVAYMKFYLLRFSLAKLQNLLKGADLRSIFSIFLQRVFRLKKG